jgi:hypothetical protein
MSHRPVLANVAIKNKLQKKIKKNNQKNCFDG